MTLREIHKQFDIYLDKIASESYPEILPTEKDVFINNAIDSLVKTRYGKNNIYKVGFEEIQKRTDELDSLVKTKFPLLSEVVYEDNTYKAHVNTLYDDIDKLNLFTDRYWFYLKSFALVNSETCGNRYVECKLIQQDDLSRVLKDPFNKPTKDKVLIYFEDDGILIKCAENNTVENFKLTFLKQPAKVFVDTSDTTGNSDIQCDLPESLHVDIVKLAVKEALEVLEIPRQQTYQNNLNNLE